MLSWATPPSCQPPVDERNTIGAQGLGVESLGSQAKDAKLPFGESEGTCTVAGLVNYTHALHIHMHAQTVKRPHATVLLNDVRMLLVGRAEGIVNEDTSGVLQLSVWGYGVKA